ncbi:MAG TPA: hypothetical protein VGI58_20525 [Streptosporangiaceae bacterium]|jgi:hypothetical protein
MIDPDRIRCSTGPRKPPASSAFGRDKLYDLMRAGRLDSIKEGGARFVTADALRAYVSMLEVESTKAA